MITAEMQRVLLLVALAATAYMLVLAWNDDYIKGRPVPGASNAPVATAPANESPDTFTEAQQEPKEVNARAAEEPGHQQTTEAAPGAERLIHVSTGVLTSGSIVSAETSYDSCCLDIRSASIDLTNRSCSWMRERITPISRKVDWRDAMAST